MKIHLSVLMILVFAVCCFGQKSVAELKPAHAIALEEFLSKNKDYQFLSENVIPDEELKYMRKDFGKNFKPYYIVGDFNSDKILDFALILSKKGEPKDNGESFAETHRFDYPIAIVIFNGTKSGGFRKAFIEDTEAPLPCFLNLSYEKKKRLTFGVYETDAGFLLTPIGKGYVVEYEKEL
jgi:hypothetical protein